MYSDRIADNLFRIRIPFEEISTTVYLAVYNQGVAIIDSGTYNSDVDNYIIPALNELGIETGKVKHLLLTHTHGDHAGGIRRLAELIPEAKAGFLSSIDIQNAATVTDGETLLGGLQVIHLPGHTKDSVGYYDIKTRTLLSGDCLQLKGIGKYRKGIGYPELYAQSIYRLMKIKPERIVAAHEYDPLGSLAEGRAEVERYLSVCLAECKRKP